MNKSFIFIYVILISCFINSFNAYPFKRVNFFLLKFFYFYVNIVFLYKETGLRTRSLPNNKQLVLHRFYTISLNLPTKSEDPLSVMLKRATTKKLADRFYKDNFKDFLKNKISKRTLWPRNCLNLFAYLIFLTRFRELFFKELWASH